MIERWTAGAEWLRMVDAASVSQVRELVRRRSAEAQLDGVATESLAIAASELATNQLRHAQEGRVAVRLVRRAGVAGVEVIAADRGPGIADPASALAGRPSTAGGLGAGLAGARRLSQELDLDVRLGEGTCVRVRRFAAPVPRSEVAVFGRALPGELVSGDDAGFARTEESLLLALCDGLGHGPEARAASRAAIDAVLAAPEEPLKDLLLRAAAAVVGTRGAVLGLARVQFATRAVEHVGVGDVRASVVGPGGLVVLAGAAGVLAGRPAAHGRPRIRQDDAILSPHGLLLLHTDGLRSAAAPGPGPVGELVAVVHDLATRFARPTDDLLVLAARTG